LKRLRTVVLISSPVTDADLASLKGLPHLRSLDLNADSKLTDAGLVNLRDLRNLNQLEMLDLSNTQVTDTGVAKLQKALPNCDIRKL